MVTKIINGRWIATTKVPEGASVYIENGRITHITSEELPYDTEINAKGCFVAPGFIDIHVHGGGGADFMDGGTSAIVTAVDYHMRHGTTSILPTALSSSHETMCRFLEDLRTVMEKKMTQANVLGTHIEGPYFSQIQSGAQNPLYIRDPDPAEYQTMLKEYGDIILRWSFAPERKGAKEFCETLIACGVAPSIAHSNAVYQDIKQVYEVGCRSVTHLYCGMSTITKENGYRHLGVVESAYVLDDMYVEVIADGKHLPPELLKLVLNGKTKERVCLVTDAMRAAGTDVTESLLGPLHEAMPCVVEDDVAKLPERTSFAGSVATADRLIRTMVKQVGVSVEDAVYMMTEVPACMLNLATKGKIAVGYDADLVVFNDNIDIKNVIIGGKEYGTSDM